MIGAVGCLLRHNHTDGTKGGGRTDALARIWHLIQFLVCYAITVIKLAIINPNLQILLSAMVANNLVTYPLNAQTPNKIRG